MEVTVQHLGNVKFSAATRGHTIICDQPPENGGGDEAMTPPELLLASLATCAAFYAVQYLKARTLPSAGLEVKVTAEKAAQPARLGSFRIEVTAPGIEARHEQGIERAVHHCLIHNTLLHAPAIETVVRTGCLQSDS
jgi:putative redox protein